MNDGAIDLWLSVARLVGGKGRPEDAEAVINALARVAQTAGDLFETKTELSKVRGQLWESRNQLTRAQDQRRDERTKARASFGDGCVVLRCGARLLIDGGQPTRIHDGDPPDDERPLRRAQALEEASAIWGEKLMLTHDGWREDGEVELVVDDIPF